MKSGLRILTGKKHPPIGIGRLYEVRTSYRRSLDVLRTSDAHWAKIKLQRLRKIRILTFGLLVHQNNSFQEVLKLEQIFQKK